MTYNVFGGTLNPNLLLEDEVTAAIKVSKEGKPQEKITSELRCYRQAQNVQAN